MQAILTEMTEDPTAPKPAMTVALAQKPHVDIKQKLSVLPSKMVALLHKALLEQKHDEANQRHAFEEGQQDLQQQEAVTKKKVRTDHQVEDPNMELAKYIEKEEKQRKLALPSSKLVKKHAAVSAAAHGAAHAKAHVPPAKAKAHAIGAPTVHTAPAAKQPPALAHEPASAEVSPARDFPSATDAIPLHRHAATRSPAIAYRCAHTNPARSVRIRRWCDCVHCAWL
jgi:hypothetical protein